MSAPILLVPGIGSDEALFPTLENSSVVVPDGESINEMVEIVLAAVPDEPFTLVGHSLGGYVAIRAAAAAPTRISRLILISTSARSDTPAQIAARLALIDQVEADFESTIEQLVPALVWSPDAGTVPYAEAVIRMLKRCGKARMVRQLRAALERPALEADARSIEAPTVVTGGVADRVVPSDATRDLARCIAGADFVPLDRCGHLPPLERRVTVASLIQ